MFSTPRALGLPDHRSLPLARVVSVNAQSLHVLTIDGPQQLPRRPHDPLVVVGDIVEVPSGALQPRRGLLQRGRDNDRQLGGAAQPLAANVDEVWCVVGADQGVNQRRLERAQLMAWDAGAVPVVVLTKADLIDDDARGAALEDIEAVAAGVDVVVCSAVTSEGIIALAARLRPDDDGDDDGDDDDDTDDVDGGVPARTAALLGVSGAGKSALVNALMRQDVQREGALRDDDGRGRHTTTTRALLVLPGGGCLIDTPGLRAFGVAADDDDVDRVFADVAALADGCRFRDCAHDREPGCAVRDVVDADRLRAFRALKAEAAERRVRSEGAAGHALREARRRDRAFTTMAWEVVRHKRR